LGYAVGSEELIEALLKIKDSYNIDRLTQEVATAALTDQPHMQHNAGRIKATRERLAQALAVRGFDVSPSEANFLWVRPGRRAAHDVFEALKARDVLVRYFPGVRTGAYLRITVGSDEEVDCLLSALPGDC